LGVADAASDEVTATISLDDVQDLRDDATARPLFRTERLRHWVTLKITVPREEVGSYCERKWVCENGTWVKTDEIRLGETEIIGEVPPEIHTYHCETASQVADAFQNELVSAERTEQEAAQARTDLRTRCSGG
jgi:hypothetical protein